jgi:hypothetical protein
MDDVREASWPESPLASYMMRSSHGSGDSRSRVPLRQVPRASAVVALESPISSVFKVEMDSPFRLSQMSMDMSNGLENRESFYGSDGPFLNGKYGSLTVIQNILDQ